MTVIFGSSRASWNNKEDSNTGSSSRTLDEGVRLANTGILVDTESVAKPILVDCLDGATATQPHVVDTK
jgi:hypothetical protein